MKQNTWIAVALAAALIFFGYSAAARFGAPDGSIAPATDAATTSVVDGKQIVNLTAKGGYAPTLTSAKAGLPTVLRVATDGTYDCSLAIRIPSLGVSRTLPPTGTTDIDLGTPSAGTLSGTCSMGMYRFAVNFN